MPNASNSVRFHPAPIPRTKRPVLSSSMPAAIFAMIPGGWNAAHATSGPTVTLRVIAASPAISVQASHGPRSGRPSPRYSRWSPSQIESKPASSAALAIATYSGQRTSRSTSGSWIPTRSGRVIRGSVCGGPGSRPTS